MDAPYRLIAWRYGVIAWVAPEQQIDPGFIERLEDAVEAAFGFWGFPVPSPGANWQHPEENAYQSDLASLRQLRVKDPTTDMIWRVNPLGWGESQIYPLVALVFPDEDSQVTQMGDDGRPWFTTGTIGIPGITPKLASLVTNPRVLVCLQVEELSTLVHESAHWVATEWLAAKGITERQLPIFLSEGLAEFASAPFRDDAAARRDYLRQWVGLHSLASELPFDCDNYLVGESVISYLYHKYGREGLPDQLRAWIAEPERMIQAHEKAWKRAEELTSPTWGYWLATIGMLIAVLGSGNIVRRVSAGRRRYRA